MDGVYTFHQIRTAMPDEIGQLLVYTLAFTISQYWKTSILL
jgi:hypothetical protein